MQMSEMGTEGDPVQEADPWLCLNSEEQGAINKQTYGLEVHAKLHLVPNRLENNHKPFQAKCFSCCGAFDLPEQPLEKIHQDCDIKRPLSPQRADSQGGDNAQAVAAAWNP